MKTFRLLCLLLAAAATAPVVADDLIVGKVANIYIRESTNFFIEARLVRESRGREVWTEVRFAEPLADGRSYEIVKLSDTAKIERGDLVSARLVARRDTLPGLIPEINRMVALVAKHDSIAALTFGAPRPLPPAAFVQAAAH